MVGPTFPSFTWESSGPIKAKALTSAFLEHRPNEHWVLVGQGIAQCDAQLWTAWNSAARRQSRGTSLGRSFDAEFLRYLSGTHHVSEAFKRAGVRDEDYNGCFLFLPSQIADQNRLPKIDENQMELLVKESTEMATSLGLVCVSNGLSFDRAGANRLGVDLDEHADLDCDVLIGHILSSEFHS
jgi:hypothetical protein